MKTHLKTARGREKSARESLFLPSAGHQLCYQHRADYKRASDKHRYIKAAFYYKGKQDCYYRVDIAEDCHRLPL